jgi:hypothetical protein
MRERLTIRLDAELRQCLTRWAIRCKQSPSALIRYILSETLHGWDRQQMAQQTLSKAKRGRGHGVSDNTSTGRHGASGGSNYSPQDS